MTPKFAIGDTVKIKRSGLEIEVTELHPTDPARVVCGWFDDAEIWWEVLFNVADLELVKAKEQAVEVTAEMPDKPVSKPRKRKAVEAE